MVQQVQVEGRGHAEFVVVGGLQRGHRLDQVDADQQRAALGGGMGLASACDIAVASTKAVFTPAKAFKDKLSA